MKSLLFETEEEIEIGPEAHDNQDKVDILLGLIKKNVDNSEKFIYSLNDCIYLDMPFGLKGTYSVTGGLVIRTLEIIDHAVALNEAWGLNLDEKKLFFLALIRSLPHGGFGDCAPKYIKTVKSTIRGGVAKWHKSPYYDYTINGAKVLEHLVEIGFTKSFYLIPLIMNTPKDKEFFCVLTAETYVDNFLEKV
ncbi:hypothetical protein MASR1M48_16630 [Lactococcus petauri]